MTPLTAEINQILSLLTVAGDAIVILLLIAFLAKYLYHDASWINFIGSKGLWLAFVVALVTTSGSLFYSEIAGFEPCKLCWLQRIFMFPQVILLGTALWKKDRRVADYSITLSLIGAAIAAYHYLLQLGIAPSLPCSAVGSSVSCSKIFVRNFGYITLPMMALTAFLLMIGFMATVKVSGKADVKAI